MMLRFLKSLSNKMIFGLSILGGLIVFLSIIAYGRWQSDQQIKSHISTLAPNIWVSDQLQLNSVWRLANWHVATIIDLRPDGEEATQPPSAMVNAAANASHIHFAYVPVPHGDIPDTAVAALDKALADNPKPILLYCHSGRRAARTWSLVEASHAGGMNAKEILTAVKSSGQNADDLEAAIVQRISHRTDSSKGAQ